jgi:hypothetical protein
MSFITQGKTNWKFLLIVIILAILVGGGALWYTRRPESSYQPVEITKSETADWKTYRNEEYGFEIKYPVIAVVIKNHRQYPSDSNYLLGLDIESLHPTFSPQLEIIGKDYLEDCFYSYLNKSVKKEKVIINNEEFCLNVDEDEGPGFKDKYYSYAIKSKKVNKFIVFQFTEFIRSSSVYPDYEREKLDEENAMNSFKQVLSTFRFLE